MLPNKSQIENTQELCAKNWQQKSFLSLIALILSSQVKKESRERLNLHLCVCVFELHKRSAASRFMAICAAYLRPDLWKRLFAPHRRARARGRLIGENRKQIAPRVTNEMEFCKTHTRTTRSEALKPQIYGAAHKS